MTPRRKGQGGQATVELALVLPLLVLVVLGVVQVAIVGRDAVAVTHATRAAARAAVVDADSAQEAAERATSLDPTRLRVTVEGDRTPGSIVTVHVVFDDPTDVPIVGRFLGDVRLSDDLSARVE